MRMEIDLASAGAEVRASTRWSHEDRTAPNGLGSDFDVDAIARFADGVRAAAANARPLDAGLLDAAQALHRAVLRGLDPLRTGLAAAPGNPLLVRLWLLDPKLQGVPWEALCRPGEAMGFWASSPALLPVRGVTTSEPWQPRAVRGALRVLAVAPLGGAGLDALRSALGERIDTGEMEWLDPLVGPAARASALFDRLRREPIPHVLHFVGHGGQHHGVPVLQFADEDGDARWVPAELLAQQIQASLRSYLRLIVLEACEGARPSAFASAAEILARTGVDAVVAHLWPVKADVARACSAELYRALAAGSQNKGDVAFSMNEARRALLVAFDGSAEAFSPVVYLRGPDSVIFDFKGRKIVPPAPLTHATPVTRGIDPALGRMLGKPFSLLLGDRFRGQRPLISGFRDKLHKELAKAAAPAAPGLSMSSLAQRVALHRGVPKLDAEFQKTFRGGAPPPPFIEALARAVGPGVHTTLLRHPWLEQAVAEKHPRRTIYVLHQGDQGLILLCREAGGTDWEELDAPPETIDPEQEIVLFRPYGGYTPEHVFARPLLTEDDYQLSLRDLDGALPRDLANAILSTLSYRPALLLGMSVVTGHHRLLLHRLYPRGVPRGSLAVIDPEDAERELWKKGSGLPGKNEGLDDVIEASMEDLAEAFGGEDGA
ncbi:CHAT domain-containing protein [Sorangium sp. So ce426]|uniref:CHAT domain-containing protein n=1 Tax=Sorangium sp. So ce426 TaxID=3133312 RepID=UPI003F5C692E